MSDNYDDEEDYEQMAADEVRQGYYEVVALIALLLIGVVITVGLIGWVFSGDTGRLLRTVFLAFCATVITTWSVNRLTYVEAPSQPLPNHPDMIQDEDN